MLEFWKYDVQRISGILCLENDELNVVHEAEYRVCYSFKKSLLESKNNAV